MVNMKKPLLVTDQFLEKMENGPVEQTINSLKDAQVDFAIYDGV